MENKQRQQKQYFDRHSRQKQFNIGEAVHVLNFSRNRSVVQRWIPGTVVQQMGNVIFIVRLEESGICVKRHKRQMRSRQQTHCIPELEKPLDETQNQNVSPNSHGDRSDNQPRRSARVTRPPQQFAEQTWT